MKTIYIPGDEYSFKAYIDAKYDEGVVELQNVDGKNRWVVTADGEKFIVRPEDSKSQ